MRASAKGEGVKLVALFRYDLASSAIRSESTLVTVRISENRPELILAEYEGMADRLASILATHKTPARQYDFPAVTRF